LIAIVSTRVMVHIEAPTFHAMDITTWIPSPGKEMN
jgi:hypothetical protein